MDDDKEQGKPTNLKDRIRAEIRAEIMAVAKKATKAVKGKKTKAAKKEDDKTPKKLSAKINAKIKRKVRHVKQGGQTHAVKENRLELLFTIVNRSKAEYYVDLLHSFDINMQVVLLGEGTAASDNTMALLGLDDRNKAVILSVIKQKNIKEALAELEDKFAKIKNGKGIAFTVPLDGVIGTLIYGFLSDNRMTVKDDSGKGSKGGKKA